MSVVSKNSQLGTLLSNVLVGTRHEMKVGPSRRFTGYGSAIFRVVVKTVSRILRIVFMTLHQLNSGRRLANNCLARGTDEAAV